jgi:hypothetical protein
MPNPLTITSSNLIYTITLRAVRHAPLKVGCLELDAVLLTLALQLSPSVELEMDSTEYLYKDINTVLTHFPRLSSQVCVGSFFGHISS